MFLGELVILCLLQLAACSKRGTGWGFGRLDDLAALHDLTFFYNWGTGISAQIEAQAVEQGTEFVPMQWSRWNIEHLAQLIHKDAQALLGFNEPNHRQQANLQPREAAELWPYLESVARERGLRLGAPAAAPCGANCIRYSPFIWWDEFFGNCTGCQFDFLATHLYTCNAQQLQSYLNDCKRYGMPLWVTEFSCPNGRDGPLQRQASYMKDALRLMDADADVERYAWYAPRTGGSWLGTTPSLLEPNEPVLTKLGRQYIAPEEGTKVSMLENSSESWLESCSACIDHAGRVDNMQLPFSTHCNDCGFWNATSVISALNTL